ncbi:MAG: hypothetical protein AB1540_17130 [Bdellovibrionota bacterium]
MSKRIILLGLFLCTLSTIFDASADDWSARTSARVEVAPEVYCRKAYKGKPGDQRDCMNYCEGVASFRRKPEAIFACQVGQFSFLVGLNKDSVSEIKEECTAKYEDQLRDQALALACRQGAQAEFSRNPEGLGSAGDRETGNFLSLNDILF